MGASRRTDKKILRLVFQISVRTRLKTSSKIMQFIEEENANFYPQITLLNIKNYETES